MFKPYVSRLEWAAEADATPWARRHARDVLRAWQVADEGIDTIELAISELVTNAVRHVTEAFPESPLTRVTLTLRMEYSRLIVEVADASDRLPMISGKVADDSESGRGLYIVQAISKEWGFYRPPTGGKVVWCVIALA
jgi:anti-sigma regulatory factor (Ser/Thr protein kinase)